MEGDISADDDIAQVVPSRFIGAREEPGRARRHRVASGGGGCWSRRFPHGPGVPATEETAARPTPRFIRR